jgi:hypothetical protein
MALQKTIVKENNFGQQSTLKDVYIKVVSTNSTKEEVQSAVHFFESANGKSLFTEIHAFPLNLNGENPIKQAYLHLKTLPEFADAVDC